MDQKPSFLREVFSPAFMWMVAAAVATGIIWAKKLDDRVSYLEQYATQIPAIRIQAETQAIAASGLSAQLTAIQAEIKDSLDSQRAMDQRLQTELNALLAHNERIAP